MFYQMCELTVWHIVEAILPSCFFALRGNKCATVFLVELYRPTWFNCYVTFQGMFVILYCLCLTRSDAWAMRRSAWQKEISLTGKPPGRCWEEAFGSWKRTTETTGWWGCGQRASRMVGHGRWEPDYQPKRWRSRFTPWKGHVSSSSQKGQDLNHQVQYVGALTNIFTPNLGEGEPILTNIFRWVGSTTKKSILDIFLGEIILNFRFTDDALEELQLGPDQARCKTWYKMRTQNSQPIISLPPWKLTYPLKNDGWKMYFLLK